VAGLSQRLFALGRPNLERQLAHPTVRGIAAGDLEPARFRRSSRRKAVLMAYDNELRASARRVEFER
jgi:hypothetical protein